MLPAIEKRRSQGTDDPTMLIDIMSEWDDKSFSVLAGACDSVSILRLSPHMPTRAKQIAARQHSPNPQSKCELRFPCMKRDARFNGSCVRGVQYKKQIIDLLLREKSRTSLSPCSPRGDLDRIEVKKEGKIKKCKIGRKGRITRIHFKQFSSNSSNFYSVAIATALEQFLASELKKLPGIKNCLEFQPIGILKKGLDIHNTVVDDNGANRVGINSGDKTQILNTINPRIFFTPS
ncbi:hypothetical protein TNCV_4165081 [Trichonephila clavipes]|nr:hypothetical protein TNCV_4165081 [Trichonephila clavipes]